MPGVWGDEPTTRTTSTTTPRSSGSSGGGGVWGSAPAKAPKSTKSDPVKSLLSIAHRLTSADLPLAISEQVGKKVLKATTGIGRDVEQSDPVQTVIHGGTSLASAVLRNVSRPGQAVLSAVAEGSRQGEEHPTLGGHLKFGELSFKNVHDVLEAGRQGFMLERHDTPMSISRTAGDIRKARGESTKAFGVLPGSDLRTNPLGAPKSVRGVSNVVYDVGGATALDPLTYLTFGTSGLVKAGLKGAEEAIGAERAAVLASKGLKALSEEERAALAAKLPAKAYEALAGARGGVGVRLPSPSALREGRLLGEARTVVPGAAIRKLTRPLAPVGRAIAESGVGRTAEDLFRPRAAVRRTLGEGVAEKLDDARVRYRGTVNSTVEDDVNRIVHAAKQAGVTDDELRTVVGPALDIGHENVQVPEHLQPLVDTLKQVRQDLTDAQLSAGVLSPERMHETDEYLPRVLTGKGEKFLNLPPARVPGGTEPSLSGLRDSFRQGRTLMPESSIADVNKAMGGKVGGEFFETNPLKAMTARSVKARRAVATKGFLDDITRITGHDGQPLVHAVEDTAAAVPHGHELVTIPQVGSFHMPSELAGEVKRIADLQINDSALKGLLSGLDKWQQLWKGYATVPLPFGLGFHERNAIGNVFNNWLAGISPGDAAYAKAMTLQRRMAKGRAAGDIFKFLGPTDRDLVDAARRYDIVGEGFFGADLPADVAERARATRRTAGETAKAAAGKLNPLSQNNALISGGRRFGSAVENNARLAHFIAQARDTGSYASAARSVRKYLFDYSDLTAAEKNAFKRINGFYTFTRKNLPVQIETLLKDPSRFSHYQQARVGIADQAEGVKGPYPDYLADQAGIPLPLGVSRLLSRIPGIHMNPDEQIVASPDVPFLNASDVLTPVANLLSGVPGVGRAFPKGEGPVKAIGDIVNKNLVGGAPGALSTAMELAAGKELFSGRQLRAGQYEDAPYYALPFAKRRVDDQGQAHRQITTRSRFAAEQLLPLLSKLATFLPRGEADEAKADRRRISAATGLRLTPLNAGTQQSEVYRRLDELNQLRADLEAQGYDIPAAKKSPGLTALSKPKPKKKKGA